MITRAGDEHELFREQYRRQMARPVMDDEPYRTFASTAEYRQWCDENLPRYLGNKIGHP